jgi:hypothetical protein
MRDSENDFLHQNITLRNFICHLETISDPFSGVGTIQIGYFGAFWPLQLATKPMKNLWLCTPCSAETSPILYSIIPLDYNNQNTIPALW